MYYKTEKAEKRTSYELYTVQKISGQEREIPFALESTGTQAVLELLPFFLNAADGATVVIDELDTGIHDKRVCDLLTSIFPEINGQMIITTHNTMLMETDLPPNSFYTISKDERGNRSIKCITEIGGRIHPNHNIRERYNHGVYFGTPTPLNLSLKEMLEFLQMI